MLQPWQQLAFAQRALQRLTLSPFQLQLRSYATKKSAKSKAKIEAKLAKLGDASQSKGANSGSAVIRTYKPRTPGVRHLRRPINDHLWKGRPFLPLTYPKKGQSKGGRNASGRITVRHRGGGAKRRIRVVDFERRVPGPHLVERIEYDPGRSAHIALLSEKATGRKSYIIAADGIRAGDVVHSYRAGIPQKLLASMGGVVDPGILASKTAFKGNCLPIHLIPVGTTVFCVGSAASRGAVFCRSAGTSAVIVNKNEETKDDGSRVMTGKYVEVRLQSGEVRRVSKDACATIGVASNVHHAFRQLGKAGRSRWLNIRPTVRGVAMNKGASKEELTLSFHHSQNMLMPFFLVDHPHGGGRGKSKSNRHPVTPWGKPVSPTISPTIRAPEIVANSFYRPRVVSRLAALTTPTSGLSKLDLETMVSGEASASRSDIPATHKELAKTVWVACIPKAKFVSYKCYIRNAWVKCVYTLPSKALGQIYGV